MSLELGEAFAAALDRLSGAVVRSAEAEFSRLAPDESGSLQPSFVILIARVSELLEVAGRSAEDLAGGYLRGLGSEADRDVTPAEAPAEVLDPFGRRPGELVSAVPAKVYLGLAQGRPDAEAFEIGRAAMRSIAETWVRDSARFAITRAIEANESLLGFRWWSRGTCGACLALDDAELRSGTMDTHPNCQCVPEPIVQPAPPNEVTTGAEPSEGAREMAEWIRKHRTGDWIDAQLFRDKFAAEFGPAGKAFDKTMQRWVGGRYKVLRAEIEDLLAGGAGSADARALLDVLSASEANAPALFRGMALKEDLASVLERYVKGDLLDLPLTSFTTAREQALGFAAKAARGGGKVTRIVIRMEKGAQALKAEGFGQNLWEEREWVSGGRFEIVNVSKSTQAVYGSKPISTVTVTLRQVGTFAGA